MAIAARKLQKAHKVKKILIVDWDVHHGMFPTQHPEIFYLTPPSGNGIQKEFYKDPNVLFISIHRYDAAKFYPSQEEAYLTYIGQGFGEGFNVNIPWNTGDKNDVDYIHAFQHVVMPIAYEFDPDFVFGTYFYLRNISETMQWRLDLMLQRMILWVNAISQQHVSLK